KVREATNAGLDEGAEPDAPLIGQRDLFGPVAVGDAVAPTRDLELVQVAVGPAHAPLQDRVELRERNRLRDQDASPDKWLHPAQFNAQLRSQCGERRYAALGSAAACSRSATRHGSNSSRRLIGCVAMRSSTSRR